MQPSLKTIAKAAGVTEATVSMALRRTGTVSEKRRRQILEIARKLNYTPNFNARGLSTGKSQLIGLVSATAFTEVSSHLIDLFEHGIRSEHYQMLGGFHQGEVALEERLMRDMIGRKIDGVAGFPAAHGGRSPWELLRKARIPFVVFNDRLLFPHNRVCVDFAKGAELMVDHLVSLGRRKLAFVCTGATSYPVRERLRGWRLACERHGIDFDTRPLFSSETPGTAASLPALAGKAARFTRRVDGFCAGNDTIAIAILQALHQRGVSVPEDAAVIGFDDLWVASLLPQPLSTIRQPLAEAARRSVEILLRQIIEPEAALEEVVLAPELVVRATTTTP